MSLNKIIEKLNDNIELSKKELILFLNSTVETIDDCAQDIGIETDLIIEAAIEQSMSFSSDNKIITPIEKFWINTSEIPGGTFYEIIVRCAEVLADAYIKRGIDIEEVRRMAISVNWRERLIAAWVTRNMDISKWDDVYKILAKDTFTDDNGYYLVREGLGLHDK
jgi:hypothetical protein